ncbi:Uncharacterised protein [Mycobacteroides abscessus subsp. abscessus]|nr:Uncharacterised protein [Mycobacteroides abscessus subsp. abscessus]
MLQRQGGEIGDGRRPMLGVGEIADAIGESESVSAVGRQRIAADQHPARLTCAHQ